MEAKVKDEYHFYYSAWENDKRSLESDEEREKEKFWTVVLDTINYIYCLKLVWTYLEAGGK